MSTRSLTVVKTRRNTGEVFINAVIYRHCDGYLAGHGRWLAECIWSRREMDGARLAAEITSGLDRIGERPRLYGEEIPLGQEYVYVVMTEQDGTDEYKWTVAEIEVREGPTTYFGYGGEECKQRIFRGSLVEFVKFVEVEVRWNY